jgi:simple sugar transport system substrate-binding protein
MKLFTRLFVTVAISAAMVPVITSCKKAGDKKATDDKKPADDKAGGGQGEQPADQPAPAGSDEKFAIITHGSAGDAFWDVVKKGAEQAGADLGVGVTYRSNGDAAQQADLINTAVTEKASGIVVSMANPDALAEPIKKAIAAGIPVITINSGSAKSAELGALAHVGQEETIAGQGAGKRLKEAGVKKLLCVVHEAGNIGLEQRCSGAKQGLGGAVVNLQVDISNVAEAQSTIGTKLQADKSLDGVLALNPAIGMAAAEAVAAAGSKAQVATFDMSGDVVDAIAAGKLLFAVDQQQYLQGYLPVVMLHLYASNANTIGGGQPVLTGPGFVTKENAAKVKDLAAKGTR